jgi:hypothetical protein
MHKLILIAIVAAASVTAAPCMAAVAAGAPAVRGHVLLVRGMGGGSFGGMNPGSAGGMNPGSQGGMSGNSLIGHTDAAPAAREADCTPSFWSRIFGSNDDGRCAAASDRKPVSLRTHRPAKLVVRRTSQVKSADAATVTR